MSLSVRTRILAVWLLLVAATLLSWETRGASDRRLATSAALLIALMKARLIGLEFMELRRAPLALRLAFELWVLVVCAGLLGLYWLSPAAT
jgi:hypothetical protein